MIIYSQIENLLQYAQSHLLLDELDVIYVRNKILTQLRLEDYVEYEVDIDAIEEMTCPDEVLNPIVDYAIANGIITEDDREEFGDRIMDIVSLRPSQVVDTFESINARSAQKAFAWLHDYGIKNDYIKATKIARNKHWEAKSTKGKLEITINLSKPEKNNKDTAKLLKTKASTYPSCMICRDNVGFAGHGVFRQTLRTVPLNLGGEDWFWQFSPYAYFEQHGIAINSEHTPMKVIPETVVKLLDFVDYAPMYFIGCNAALPIVGGSILTHDHFQGGAKQLPMHKAPDLIKFKCADYPYVDTTIVDWYNSVIRLTSTNRKSLAEYAGKIIEAWKEYSDESVDIIANDGTPHNAITPIARKSADGKYIVELILRNNCTSEKYPDGIYHVHPENQNIKSEAIGLIEAMGLFILPGRLNRQLAEVEKYITREVKYSRASLADDMKIHADMIEKLMKENPKASAVEAALAVKEEVNRVCEDILDNTAVFKKDEKGFAAFEKFLNSVGIYKK
ncbi:MAG: UDP-glucose--hexose-1-phosphate uridylyltransferase [Clostridia bacterium]|nr:UDP-glucose--hexose-1-phosphate uridylyltransferase [Clostridia bacterium]